MANANQAISLYTNIVHQYQALPLGDIELKRSSFLSSTHTLNAH